MSRLGWCQYHRLRQQLGRSEAGAPVVGEAAARVPRAHIQAEILSTELNLLRLVISETSQPG